MRGLVFCLAVSVSCVFAATRYVALNGGDIPPYTNWASAARSVHTAVAAAQAGDTVILSNGTYYLSETVQLTKDITLTSLSGPLQTILNGSNAVQVVEMNSASAVLSRLTITRGNNPNMPGGVRCINGLVDQCVIISNAAPGNGGGAMYVGHNGKVYNTLMCYNSSDRGGGVYTDRGTFINCTIVRNTATSGSQGGGIAVREGPTRIINSILYNNAGGNLYSYGGQVICEYSCVTPLPAGQGNITNDPLFVNSTSDFHLAMTSLCRDAGTNLPELAATTDLDGHARVQGGRVDMGAYEFGGIHLSITSAPVTLAHSSTDIGIAGTNDGCVGMLWASNAANGLVYTFPAAQSWASPPIALAVGVNHITAYGTNATALLSYDAIAITRQAATPEGLTATDGTFTERVALVWQAAPAAESYRVLRSESNDLDSASTVANDIPDTACDDTTATPGVEYYYWVVAQQNGVEGEASAPDSGYRQLTAADMINATLGDNASNVYVHWAAVPGATQYRVYRATAPQTNLTEEIAAAVSATNYTDESATPGMIYYYWVQAESMVAAGAWSGMAPGYALLVADFADKKTWSMKDAKTTDTLTCKRMPAPWGALFDAGWRIAIVNSITGEIISGPFELVTTKGKIWTLKNEQAQITYTEKQNAKKGTFKAKLKYTFAGDMPRWPGVKLYMAVAP